MTNFAILALCASNCTILQKETLNGIGYIEYLKHMGKVTDINKQNDYQVFTYEHGVRWIDKSIGHEFMVGIEGEGIIVFTDRVKTKAEWDIVLGVLMANNIARYIHFGTNLLITTSKDVGIDYGDKYFKEYNDYLWYEFWNK